jgi:hypothetical protein
MTPLGQQCSDWAEGGVAGLPQIAFRKELKNRPDVANFDRSREALMVRIGEGLP